MQVIAGSNEIDFSTALATQLGLELNIPSYKLFNDGETSIRLQKKPDDDVLIIQSLYHPQDTRLLQLFNLVSTCKRLGSRNVTVYTPYLAYARSDREVLDFEAISARTVIQILESLGVNHLITLDVHNPEIIQYASDMTITNLYPTKSIAKHFRENLSSLQNLAIVAPDQGSVDRAKLLAAEMDVQYFSLKKNRDPVTGEVEVETTNLDINTNNVIIVDDIISTGSSLIRASALLKIHGVSKIHFFITHFVNPNALDALKEVTDGIILTSHSVPSLLNSISTIDDLRGVLEV